MRTVYTLAWWLLLPLAFLYLLWRSVRQPEYRQYWPQRRGYAPQLTGRPVIWLHAVSVGETRAAEPLVRMLQERYRDHVLLLTHTTPTGRATGFQLFGDSVAQAYLPYDLPLFINRFLDLVQPELGLIMETEVWPNLFAAVRGRGIPLYLVNARMSERSARGYARLGALSRPSFAMLSGVAAQTADDACRLRELGARDVMVTGNLKFDVDLPGDLLARTRHLNDLIGDRFVFVAASTREGEEALILDVLPAIHAKNLLLVLVPRHPQRFDEVARLIAQRGYNYVRRRNNQPVGPETKVLLGDSMGELAAYYSVADLAFVGGSLLPLGGQNLIEAAVVGCPILIGPHTFNFEEASQQAVACGAAHRVQDALELAQAVSVLAGSQAQREHMAAAGAAFAADNRGATARVLAMITTPTDTQLPI